MIIETNNLTKTYGEVRALDQLDLQVPEHSIVGFLGPNGAGKSTTLKLLLGLIHPSSGSGRVFGLDIATQSTEIRRRVGYLAQQPRFYPNLTARQTLDFVARFFYQDLNLIQTRIDESLALVGLENKADRPIKGFSGGELQRLGIAQAQINDPELLILDEPAAALDPMGRADVLQIMEQLRHKCTVFYSTHILDDVQRVSDHVVILNHGKLVAQGPIEELLLGDGEIMYRLELSGATEQTRHRLENQAWVSDLRVERRNGHAQWSIVVQDEVLAQQRLLRLLLEDPDVTVHTFGRRRFELEEIFIHLVGEG